MMHFNIYKGWLNSEDFAIKINSITKIVKSHSMDNCHWFVSIYTNSNKFAESIEFDSIELRDVGYNELLRQIYEHIYW